MWFAALLMILGPVLVVVVAFAVFALFGIATRDMIAWGRRDPAAVLEIEDEKQWHRAKEAAERRIFLERGFARGFVILGGVFWMLAAFAGYYSFRQSGFVFSFLAACIPAFAAAFTLIIGWYWERLAAAMLAVASLVVVGWGVVFQFELGVWILMTLSLIGPMGTAAVLFWMARREHEALAVLHLSRPEPALATARV